METYQDLSVAIQALIQSKGILYGNEINSWIKQMQLMGANQNTIYTKDAGVGLYKWVTASGGKSCPDCAERAGRVEIAEYWSAVGEPQSGFSVCRQHCRCKLVPADYDGDESIEIKKIEV